MTAATKTLLAHLRQHIGSDSAKRKALHLHCCEKIGRTLSRSALHKIIYAESEPGADLLIPIMRWLQLEGVIKPGAKAVGLFIYTRPLRTLGANGQRLEDGGLKTTKPAKKSDKPAAKRRPFVF